MDLQPIHPAPTSFVRKYVFSTDHKVIAKQFLWAGLIFLALGGMLAMMIRWQWAYPGEPVPVVGSLLLGKSGGVITSGLYPSLFTMHGADHDLLRHHADHDRRVRQLLTIPLMIGARDMAFPTPEPALVLDVPDRRKLLMIALVLRAAGRRRPRAGPPTRRSPATSARPAWGRPSWWRPSSSPASPPSWAASTTSPR